MKAVIMNKSESKYYNTACLMDEALISLLEKKSYEYITVKEICEKAGVNRSTFYLHYETLEDLLSETVLFITNKRDSKFEKVIDLEYIANNSVEKLKLVTHEHLIPYLEFVKENKKVYVAATTQPHVFRTNESFNKLYNEIFNPILAKFNIPEKDRKYKIAFYLNGMFSVIMEWIKNDCVDDVEYISNLLIDCLNE